MTDLDEINKIIRSKQDKVDEDDYEELIGTKRNLKRAIEQYERDVQIQNLAAIEPENLDIYLSKINAAHIRISNGGRPWRDFTIGNILRTLPIKPYSKSSDYFGGGVGSTIQIDRPHKPSEPMPADSVFATLYPGSKSYRYGAFFEQILVPSGEFYADFTSHLQGLHEFVDRPVKTFPNGREVRELKRLNCLPLSNIFERNRSQYPICSECLSLDIDRGPAREQCEHLQNNAQMYRQTVTNFYSSPKLETSETDRESRTISATTTNLLPPLDLIFERIDYLDEIKVLIFAKGFTRKATVEDQQGNDVERAVDVEYDPYPGYVLNTNGLVLKLKPIPDEFVEFVISQNFLLRDVLIDIFAERIEQIIRDNPFPARRSGYELELWLSGAIKALELDNILPAFNWQNTIQRLATANFRNDFVARINSELDLYSSRPSISQDVITTFSQEISGLTITIDDVKSKIRSLLKISMCYLAYYSAIITSGTSDKELSFIYPKDDEDEIIIYDRAAGGNGASKLINNYLTGPAYTTSVSQEQGLRPTYFQETFLEFLRPCSQGIADRIYFQNLQDGFNNFRRNDLMTYRLDELRTLHDNSHDEFDHILNTATTRNIFPYSIGTRSLNLNRDENKKLKEVASICVHGCPECILLHSYSGPSSIPRFERFYVSKYLVDLYSIFVSQKIRVNFDVNRSDIEKILKDYGTVVISQEFDNNAYDFSELLAITNSFIGDKINNRTVKFSGSWFDCHISDTPVMGFSVSLGVI